MLDNIPLENFPRTIATSASRLKGKIRFVADGVMQMHLTEKVIISEEELILLPCHAVIVNTARGGIIDEYALARALENRSLGAVALDVISKEPPEKNHPLFDFENVIITPHSAGLTEECAERMAIRSVQNVFDFFEYKLDPELVVNDVGKLAP